MTILRNREEVYLGITTLLLSAKMGKALYIIKILGSCNQEEDARRNCASFKKFDRLDVRGFSSEREED
jgi:hypothetical protein